VRVLFPSRRYTGLLAGRADVFATNRTNVPESGANGDASLSVKDLRQRLGR
jgi:hypothetical protein